MDSDDILIAHSHQLPAVVRLLASPGAGIGIVEMINSPTQKKASAGGGGVQQRVMYGVI